MRLDRRRTAVTPQGTATSRSPRQRCFGKRRSLVGISNAFTILELLIVISIIIVLAGLILATSGYVQKKGARSRTEAEIAAISAALENYRADNGIYPTDVRKLTRSRRAQIPMVVIPANYRQSAVWFLYKHHFRATLTMIVKQ